MILMVSPLYQHNPSFIPQHAKLPCPVFMIFQKPAKEKRKLKTFMPPWYQYVWCPDDRVIGQASNWWQDEEEVIRIKAELHKINGVKGKYFVDVEVELDS